MDYNAADDFSDAQDAALAETREIAALIAGGIVTEEDFIEAARNYDEESYGDRDSTLAERMGEYMEPDFEQWLLEESRGYGDISTIETTIGTYVLFFVERDGNDHPTVSMRQILVMRENVYPDFYPEGEDDPEFLEAVEAADMEALERAQEILALFISGGATKDALIGLMEEYSDDDTDGGFYDNIAKLTYQSNDGRYLSMRVVQEIEDWLFEEGRAVGDFELIRTEAFGYHLLFFMGSGERLNEIISGDRMRSTDFLEWKDGLPEQAVVKHWSFTLTQK